MLHIILSITIYHKTYPSFYLHSSITFAAHHFIYIFLSHVQPIIVSTSLYHMCYPSYLSKPFYHNCYPTFYLHLSIACATHNFIYILLSQVLPIILSTSLYNKWYTSFYLSPSITSAAHHIIYILTQHALPIIFVYKLLTHFQTHTFSQHAVILSRITKALFYLLVLRVNLCVNRPSFAKVSESLLFWTTSSLSGC